MKTPFKVRKIPRSRLATIDVFAAGMRKHHVAALLEFDVTEARTKLAEMKEHGARVSFNAWLVQVIAQALAKHRKAAAYLLGGRKLILFDGINVSVMVEKAIGDRKVPMPMVIERADAKTAAEITREIDEAKGQALTAGDVVLRKKPAVFERLYYRLPGCLRRTVWRLLMRRPKALYRKMGNAIVTSVGMMGRIDGWFVHRSIHPAAFGVGSILEKPRVVAGEIRIREVLHMTILADHDVIDGGPMVRLLNELTGLIESGSGL
jgi:pyruvate/2-oxoglutarate dehydrogenase complex dihydrolipoamide acyltransferase (E2) component